ncbi:DUF5994 family protein [Smaragdicoccus niigatensis]|uniref:DUF5994 family protein n=1 Tax=Smaragdicoccus niigatensis TaxID=359359 RepID=UPI000368A036|nr:DUF5994 family protein [Smaragdicoccus niigatensis]
MTHSGESARRHPYAETNRTPRLLLRKASEPAVGRVDGVWWPWTTSLVVELHDLINAVTFRTGTVTQVSFRWNDVNRRQPTIEPADGVRLCPPSFDQPDGVMYVFGRAARLALVVVPAGTLSAKTDRLVRLGSPSAHGGLTAAPTR